VNEPIFILGAPRSGGTVVAGLLQVACGVFMGELLPPSVSHPLGCYEPTDVVDAHRNLLRQLERDVTCPPADQDLDGLDLDLLEAAVGRRRDLREPWAVKEPSSLFLLRAWERLGIDQIRLVGVTRSPFDNIASISSHDGIRTDRAEAIVNHYTKTLARIARTHRLPVVQFSSDPAALLQQIEDLAVTLALDFDRDAASAFLHPHLVTHSSPHHDTTPEYEDLLNHAAPIDGKMVPPVRIHDLPRTQSAVPALPRHLGDRYVQQRAELRRTANFASVPGPVLVELLLDGARIMPEGLVDEGDVYELEVSSALEVGSLLTRSGIKPDAVIAHGIVAAESPDDIDFFLRSLHSTTADFAELALDVVSTTGIRKTEPLETTPKEFQRLAASAGWEHVRTEPLPPGRSAIFFRKRVSNPAEPASTAIAQPGPVQRLEASSSTPLVRGRRLSEQLADAEQRAGAAERALEQLRGRRSVRLALGLTRTARRLLDVVRPS
jgi:hypothetical protein